VVHDGEFHVRRVTLLALLPHLTHTAGLGCRVQGSGCRVQGAGFGVQGSGFKGFRVQATQRTSKGFLEYTRMGSSIAPTVGKTVGA
jgi:hypothetical protein